MAYKKRQETTPRPLDVEENHISPETLIHHLSSANDGIRVKARLSLVTLGSAAVRPLIEALKSKNYLTKWEAAKALGEIGNPKSVPALIEALQDVEFDVRWLAAEALSKMGIVALGPVLHALMERGDAPFLREGAHHVIHDLNKGALKKHLTPLHDALTETGRSLEVPWLAKKALEGLEQESKTWSGSEPPSD